MSLKNISINKIIDYSLENMINILHFRIYSDDSIETLPRIKLRPPESTNLKYEDEERRLHVHFPRPFPGLFEGTVDFVLGDYSKLVFKAFHLFSRNGFRRETKPNGMGTIPDAVNNEGDYAELRVSQRSAPTSIRGTLRMLRAHEGRLIGHLYAAPRRRCYVLYLTPDLKKGFFDLYCFNLVR